jgi:transcription initiation factor IIE alpha subunit
MLPESDPTNACPKCGGAMHQTDKNTFTGEVWREFTCRTCGHVVDVNEGTALWQMLHDEADDAKPDEGKK